MTYLHLITTRVIIVKFFYRGFFQDRPTFNFGTDIVLFCAHPISLKKCLLSNSFVYVFLCATKIVHRCLRKISTTTLFDQLCMKVGKFKQ